MDPRPVEHLDVLLRVALINPLINYKYTMLFTLLRRLYLCGMNERIFAADRGLLLAIN